MHEPQETQTETEDLAANEALKRIEDFLHAKEYEVRRVDNSLVVPTVTEATHLHLFVRCHDSCIIILGLLPYIVPQSNRTNVALKLTEINNTRLMPFFDFDLENGHIFTKAVSLLEDEAHSVQAFERLVSEIKRAIDENFLTIVAASYGIKEAHPAREIGFHFKEAA